MPISCQAASAAIPYFPQSIPWPQTKNILPQTSRAKDAPAHARSRRFQGRLVFLPAHPRIHYSIPHENSFETFWKNHSAVLRIDLGGRGLCHHGRNRPAPGFTSRRGLLARRATTHARSPRCGGISVRPVAGRRAHQSGQSTRVCHGVAIQSLQSQLENLQSQIRALDAARTQDKRHLRRHHQKVASLIKPRNPPAAIAPPAPRPGGSMWQPGESLSKIAAAYSQNVGHRGSQRPEKR